MSYVGETLLIYRFTKMLRVHVCPKAKALEKVKRSEMGRLQHADTVVCHAFTLIRVPWLKTKQKKKRLETVQYAF